MEEDRTANQRSAFSLSFTLALYISNGFGLSHVTLYYHFAFPNRVSCFPLTFSEWTFLEMNRISSFGILSRNFAQCSRHKSSASYKSKIAKKTTGSSQLNKLGLDDPNSLKGKDERIYKQEILRQGNIEKHNILYASFIAV